MNDLKRKEMLWILPGPSSKRSLEPANGWSAFLETSRTRMKLCLDLNLTRVLTKSTGIPSPWVFVWGLEIWVFLDLGLNRLKVIRLEGGFFRDMGRFRAENGSRGI